MSRKLFEIHQRIGSGSFGQVYKGIHVSGKEVAIKIETGGLCTLHVEM